VLRAPFLSRSTHSPSAQRQQQHRTYQSQANQVPHTVRPLKAAGGAPHCPSASATPMSRPHAAVRRQQPSSSVPEAAHSSHQPLQQHTPRRQQRDGTDTAHYKHHNQVGSGIHAAGRPQGTQNNKAEGPDGADSTGCRQEAATSPKQRRRRRPEISVLGGALGLAAVRDPCSPQRAKHSPQADKCDHLGCPSSPSALRIPAATQHHTYVSAPGPRPAHGLETQERAGAHAVRPIQRPQTARRSPPEPGESARTRRRQEPPFCRRLFLGLYLAPRRAPISPSLVARGHGKLPGRLGVWHSAVSHPSWCRRQCSGP
jgi:hypothetical protein